MNEQLKAVMKQIKELNMVPADYVLSEQRRNELISEWDGFSKRLASIKDTQPYEWLQMVKNLDLKLYYDFINELDLILESDD